MILAEEEYDRLTGEKLGLLDFLISGPGLDGVDLERDRSPMRDVEL